MFVGTLMPAAFYLHVGHGWIWSPEAVRYVRILDGVHVKVTSSKSKFVVELASSGLLCCHWIGMNY